MITWILVPNSVLFAVLLSCGLLLVCCSPFANTILWASPEDKRADGWTLAFFILSFCQGGYIVLQGILLDNLSDEMAFFTTALWIPVGLVWSWLLYNGYFSWCC